MKKALVAFFMFLVMLVNGCSCHDVNIDTYNTAVRNYITSIGLDYTLDITTKVSNKNYYEVEEIQLKYELSTTREVINHYSKLKGYTVADTGVGAQGAPVPVYDRNHYYIGSQTNFYIEEKAGNTHTTNIVNVSYEDYYNKTNDLYNINNIVPVFNDNQISEFTIEEIENTNGDSKATFLAACPSYEVCQNDIIEYVVIIDRNFNFSSIEFTITSEEEVANPNSQSEEDKTIKVVTTKTYEYTFHNFNKDVVLEFPSNLGDF